MFIVLESPAPLAGMAYPDEHTDWAALHDAGFRHVVRLHAGDYDPSPLAVETIELEDLHGGRAPRNAEAEREGVSRAARYVADRVRAGEGVVVHCVGGTGRTGTVLACSLRLLGRTADDAIATVQAHRPEWPESAGRKTSSAVSLPRLRRRLRCRPRGRAGFAGATV